MKYLEINVTQYKIKRNKEYVETKVKKLNNPTDNCIIWWLKCGQQKISNRARQCFIHNFYIDNDTEQLLME